MRKQETANAVVEERPWYFDKGERPTRLSQLGLDPLTQARVLEWFAFKIWVAAEEGSGSHDYHSKFYDPLTVELRPDGGGTAHSYVFGFHDGGRHHPFASLDNLEDWLFEEAIERVAWAAQWAVDDLTTGGSAAVPAPDVAARAKEGQ